MNDIGELERLVREARQGNKESREQLARQARERVYEHIFRRTLKDDLSEEISQECMVVLSESMERLGQVERFWPWLRGVAHNKLCDYYSSKAQDEKVLGEIIKKVKTITSEHGLSKMLETERKEHVIQAMRALKQRHRDVLVLRCYEKMAFAEIGGFLGVSSFGAQMLFYRAKKSLQKQLTRQGLGKGVLLSALILFGKVTAQSKAAAAQVSITAATLKVSGTAAVAAAIATKAGVVAVTGAVVAGSSMVIPTGTTQKATIEDRSVANCAEVKHSALTPVDTLGMEWEYFFPSEVGGFWLKGYKVDQEGNSRLWVWLQNSEGNYWYNQGIVCRVNYRTFNSDLTLWLVPRDSESQRGRGTWLLRKADGRILQADQDTFCTEEMIEPSYFQHTTAAGTNVIDLRDEMHKRGWTNFRVTGNIGGERILGVGQVPFLDKYIQEHGPGIHLQAGGRIVEQASLRGLMRPWEGVHTIDTIRCDALRAGLEIEQPQKVKGGKVKISIKGNKRTLVYTVDMERDVIERIEFLNQKGVKEGEMTFTYAEDLRLNSTRPSESAQIGEGMKWLMEL